MGLNYMQKDMCIKAKENHHTTITLPAMRRITGPVDCLADEFVRALIASWASEVVKGSMGGSSKPPGWTCS